MNSIFTIILSLLILAINTTQTFAQNYPDLPYYGSYVIDNADVIDNSTEEKINQISQELYDVKGVSLYIITIKGLRYYDALHLGVPEYTKLLYKNWTQPSDEKNEIIILLFSLEDDYMQIWLKDNWKEDYGKRASYKVFDDMIMPHFSKNQYAEALLAGAEGLSNMAKREKEDFSEYEDLLTAALYFMAFLAFVILLRQRKTERR